MEQGRFEKQNAQTHLKQADAESGLKKQFETVSQHNSAVTREMEHIKKQESTIRSLTEQVKVSEAERIIARRQALLREHDQQIQLRHKQVTHLKHERECLCQQRQEFEAERFLWRKQLEDKRHTVSTHAAEVCGRQEVRKQLEDQIVQEKTRVALMARALLQECRDVEHERAILTHERTAVYSTWGGGAPLQQDPQAWAAGVLQQPKKLENPGTSSTP